MQYLLFILLILTFPASVCAEVVMTDTVWEGEVVLEGDVLILPGVTVVVRPGTVVKIFPSENTKIDPEYLSHQTEILVRGVLDASGSSEKPITFMRGDAGETEWAGIIVDGGRVTLRHCIVQGAETGVYVVKGSLDGHNSKLMKNHYAVISQGPDSEVILDETVVAKNDYGVMSFNGGKIKRQGGVYKDNEKSDEFSGRSQYMRVIPRVFEEKEQALTRIYKSETIQGNSVWSGRIRIEGQVRLAVEARLIIMPGTVVEFAKRDSNGDGIGENGILVQGAFVAKGTKGEPIIFRSAEKDRNKGDWDSINILGSDQTRNLIEFCQIEDAYRGMHFHFANVAVTNTVLRNNYRGIQFQESLVEIRDSQFYWNNSGIQARDSQVVFKNNQVFNNINGANMFRMNLKGNGNIFANNLWDGIRIREGVSTIEGNTIVGNRFGLVVADAVFGKFNANLMAGNIETGLVLRNNDHIECEENAIMANGINGMSVKESRALLRGNLISDNGERGIGVVSFSGQITGNNFSGNGQYAIGLDGPDDIDVVGNWWGGADLEREIFDRHDDPALGVADVGSPLTTPNLFTWPVATVPVDLSWSGAVRIAGRVEVPAKKTLTVKAGAVVKFEQGSGMDIFGSIRAVGSAAERIVFTSTAGKGPKDWEELYMDRAMDSLFVNCDFENATWAIHCHLSNLTIKKCRFRNNDGGFRFRGGPVEISGSIFRKNRIAIRAFQGQGEVVDNVISQNEIGIFIREKGAGLIINRNNLSDNERYSMRLGDFNAEDVNAKLNWWGTADVVSTVWDKHNESYIGLVLFDPVLEKPIQAELEEWQ